MYFYFLYPDLSLGKILNLHKAEEIRRLFESYYSDEIINKIKNFYFSENDLNEITKIEKTCHVSKI